MTSAYDELSDRARWFMENFDECGVAEICASQEAAAKEAKAAVEALTAELGGARTAIDHMTEAMSWICGHDRQGLDHLEEAQHEARGRESAVVQARRWAARARAAEAAIDRLRDVADTWFREGAPGATREAGRYILAALSPQDRP